MGRSLFIHILRNVTRKYYIRWEHNDTSVVRYIAGHSLPMDVVDGGRATRMGAWAWTRAERAWVGMDGMDGGQATHVGACHMRVWARMGTERAWVARMGWTAGRQRTWGHATRACGHRWGRRGCGWARTGWTVAPSAHPCAGSRGWS